MKRPRYTIVTPGGEEVGPRYGYEHAEEWRKANDILHPRAEVVLAPPRLPRRR